MGFLRNNFILILAVFVFCGSAFSASAGAELKSLSSAPSELKDLISQKAEELKKVNERINETQKNLEKTQEEKKTLKKEVNRINSQINQLELGIKSSEILIEKLGLETESLKYDIADIETEIENKKVAIAETLKNLQINDDETPLKIFLKNRNLAESVFEIQALSDVSGGLSGKIEEMTDLKDELGDKLNDISKKKNEKESEGVNLKNKKAITQDIKKDKEQFLETAANQEKIYQKNLSELEKIKEEIDEEINKMEEELRLKIDPSLLPTARPGVLGLPILIPPASKNFSYGQTYGFTRNNGKRYHNGLDFGAPLGTPILAAESGTVVAFGDQDNYKTNGKRLCYKGAYGKFLMIKQENNLTTTYAHLSRWIVNVGDKVERGQVIGYSGNTGRSTGPHLHFIVYATQTIPPASPGFYEGTRSSRICGPLPMGGDLNPEKYLAL